MNDRHQLQTAAWTELSDDELEARLRERGYQEPILAWFLAERDDPDSDAARSLNAIFGQR